MKPATTERAPPAEGVGILLAEQLAEVGRRVRVARVARNLTQRNLALLVGVDAQAVALIESGRTKKLEPLARVARELGLYVSITLTEKPR